MSDHPRKKQVGTSLEPRVVALIDLLARKDCRTRGSMLRKCILAGLPKIEQQVLKTQTSAGTLPLN